MSEKETVRFRQWCLTGEDKAVKKDTARFVSKITDATFEQVREVLYLQTDGEKPNCDWSNCGFYQICEDIQTAVGRMKEKSYGRAALARLELSPENYDTLCRTNRLGMSVSDWLAQEYPQMSVVMIPATKKTAILLGVDMAQLCGFSIYVRREVAGVRGR